MKLSAIECKNAKPREKQYRLNDGGNLYLQVVPNGGKYWRLKYRFQGKEKMLALGTYPFVSLKEAREKRDAAKRLLAAGEDPGLVRKREKIRNTIKYENTYENVARQWLEHRKGSIAEDHRENLQKRLEADIFPKIGQLPITEVMASDLLAVIRAIEKRGAYDLAKRAMQTSGQIFRYAVASGLAERDITPDLRGALITPKSKHHAHVSEKELPAMLRDIENYEGHILTKLGLKMLVLTFLRTTELRAGKWEEIDFEKAEWRIPVERMKMKELHIVPLASQALSLLEEIKIYSGNREHIFPGQHKPHSFMSENTLLYALYRMGYKGKATGHGFRSTASTILNENGFRSDVVEKQLAHGERNQVRKAYNHAEYLPERRVMMQWWADYVENLTRDK